MGWVINRVVNGAFYILSSFFFLTAALWLIYSGAYWAEVPALRILNGVILAVVFATLTDRTIATIRDLWPGYSDRNLLLTDLFDGAIVRIGITFVCLLPHAVVVGFLSRIHPSLPVNGVTIQTELYWAASFEWIRVGINLGLIAILILNLLFLALALYIALGRSLRFNLPQSWVIREFGPTALEQIREERDALRDEVKSLSGIQSELETKIKHAEKERVALNDQIATSYAQKQENIRLSNEAERLQRNLAELRREFSKVEADRNAGSQVIEERSRDLAAARDRIEHLERENARQRLRLDTGTIKAATEEEENPLLTLMALDTLNATDTPATIANVDNDNSRPCEDVAPPLEISKSDVTPEPHDAEDEGPPAGDQLVMASLLSEAPSDEHPQNSVRHVANEGERDTDEHGEADTTMQAGEAPPPPNAANIKAEAKRLHSQLAKGLKLKKNRDL